MTDRNSPGLTHIAYHEAGHAVAYIRLDIMQSMITIEPNAETLGRTTAEGPDSVWSEQGAAATVLALLAGYAALVAAGYSHEVAMKGADSDMEKAEDLIESWGLQPDLAYWLDQAIEMMREPRNMAAVERVAAELEQRRTIDAQLADVLVDLSDGETTPAEFATFIVEWEMDWQSSPIGKRM